MNDPFIHNQSANFAQRLQKAGSNEAARVNAAFELALGRPATSEEIDHAQQFQARYIAGLAQLNTPESERQAIALAAYLRTVLGSNEFMFID